MRRREAITTLMDVIEAHGLPKPRTMGELREALEKLRALETDAADVEAALAAMDGQPRRRVGAVRVASEWSASAPAEPQAAPHRRRLTGKPR